MQNKTRFLLILCSIFCKFYFGKVFQVFNTKGTPIDYDLGDY